jgi:hypothetical protein
VHMHVVFTDNARQDAHFFSITNLHEQISTPSLYVAFQNVIAIFRAPNNARRQTSNRMMSVPIIFHLPLFYIDFSGSKLKSCAESA